MSVRREVVTLSQLLRRNDKSNPRGAGNAPPLPLKGSAGNRRAGTQHNPAPITERTAPRYRPLTFTQRVRDANRTLTPHSELVASSQTSTVFPPLSQEVYDPENELLSAMTSMSQSSLSQSQSQNLLGSNEDDQLHHLQPWQPQQTQLSHPLSSTDYSNHKKFQELEENLTKVLAEQSRVQQQHQKEMLARFASPIKKSVKEIQARLTTGTKEHQGQRAIIEYLADSLKSVATTVTDLYQQSLANSAVYEEKCKAGADEAEAVQAALSGLQARVGSIQDGVDSCSRLVTRVLEGEGMKHVTLLSAVKASSCHCPQEAKPAHPRSTTGRVAKKRTWSSSRSNSADEKSACYTSSSSADGSPRRSKARSMPQLEIASQAWIESDNIEAGTEVLHDALRRIKLLRAKRRS